MYDHIPVALDGLEVAERILPHAEALGASFGSRVTLLRATTPQGTIVAETSTGASPIAPGLMDPTPSVEAERAEARTYLEAAAARLRARGSRSCRSSRKALRTRPPRSAPPHCESTYSR
jgi:nucleotide-binding universal stress UspA family protein